MWLLFRPNLSVFLLAGMNARPLLKVPVGPGILHSSLHAGYPALYRRPTGQRGLYAAFRWIAGTESGRAKSDALHFWIVDAAACGRRVGLETKLMRDIGPVMSLSIAAGVDSVRQRCHEPVPPHLFLYPGAKEEFCLFRRCRTVIRILR